MFKNEKNKKYLTIPTALAVMFISICSFYQFRSEIAGFYQLLTESVDHHTAAPVHINRMLLGMNEEAESPASEESSENENFYNLLFMIGSVILIKNTFRITAAVFLLAAGFVIKQPEVRLRKRHLLSRVKYYREWSVKFLDPVRKSINCRAEDYDINPVIRIREVCPRFV